MTRFNDNQVLADPCYVAESMWTRLWGLMGKSRLAEGTGLLLRPCSSVHTFFMRFAIDVVYLGIAPKAYRDLHAGIYRVVAIRRAMRPWSADLPVHGAYMALELPRGGAFELREGDLVCLS